MNGYYQIYIEGKGYLTRSIDQSNLRVLNYPTYKVEYTSDRSNPLTVFYVDDGLFLDDSKSWVFKRTVDEYFVRADISSDTVDGIYFPVDFNTRLNSSFQNGELFRLTIEPRTPEEFINWLITSNIRFQIRSSDLTIRRWETAGHTGLEWFSGSIGEEFQMKGVYSNIHLYLPYHNEYVHLNRHGDALRFYTAKDSYSSMYISYDNGWTLEREWKYLNLSDRWTFWSGLIYRGYINNGVELEGYRKMRFDIHIDASQPMSSNDQYIASKLKNFAFVSNVSNVPNPNINPFRRCNINTGRDHHCYGKPYDTIGLQQCQFAEDVNRDESCKAFIRNQPYLLPEICARSNSSPDDICSCYRSDDVYIDALNKDTDPVAIRAIRTTNMLQCASGVCKGFSSEIYFRDKPCNTCIQNVNLNVASTTTGAINIIQRCFGSELNWNDMINELINMNARRMIKDGNRSIITSGRNQDLIVDLINDRIIINNIPSMYEALDSLPRTNGMSILTSDVYSLNPGLYWNEIFTFFVSK